MSGQSMLSLVTVLEEAVAPLDSLTDILQAGGYHEVAKVSSGLIRDSRARLRETALCLEEGCGHALLLKDFGGILAPVRCEHCPKHQDCGCLSAPDS